MPKEIHYYGTSGQTLYAVALGAWWGIVWNTADFGNEYFDVSHWANYVIPMTEEGAGIYFGDAPQTGVKVYAVIYQQAGGAPATTDTIVGKFEVEINADTLAPITDTDLLGAIVSSVPDPVNAVIVGWKGKTFPWGSKISISGNDIQVAWTEEIADSNSAAYVGWAVWFELTISGYPTSYVPWLTTVVAHSGNTITVAAMPPQNLSSQSFNVYLFPPGFAGGGGGGATAEDVAAAILVTPANKLATEADGAITTVTNLTNLPATAALEATAQSILEDTGTTLPALISAGNAGSGATSYTITVQDEDSNPIDGVEVWITTDSAGTNVVAGTLSTDALGVATFMLDAGDYYVWRQRSGYNFTNPVAITVS